MASRLQVQIPEEAPKKDPLGDSLLDRFAFMLQNPALALDVCIRKTLEKHPFRAECEIGARIADDGNEIGRTFAG